MHRGGRRVSVQDINHDYFTNQTLVFLLLVLVSWLILHSEFYTFIYLGHWNSVLLTSSLTFFCFKYLTCSWYLIPDTQVSYHLSSKLVFQAFGLFLTSFSFGSVASAFISWLTDNCLWCGRHLNIQFSNLCPTPTQSTSDYNFINLVPLVSTSTRMQVHLCLQSEFFSSLKNKDFLPYNL